MALAVKNLPANTGDLRDEGLILGQEDSLGGGDGTPLQYSCLENPTDERPGGLQSMESLRVRHD